MYELQTTWVNDGYVLKLNECSPSSGTDIISACDSIIWIDGNTYTTSNNTATYYLTNYTGCDSLVSLDLSLNYSSSSIETISSCHPYTWIDGNTYNSSISGVTHTLINSSGCDSVVTLDLTLNLMDTSIWISVTALNSNQSGVQYQWLDCENNLSVIQGATQQLYQPWMSGTFALELTDGSGCKDTSYCRPFLYYLGIDKNPAAQNLNIYPNPADDVINIELPEVETKGLVTITDAQGRILCSLSTNGQSSLQINLSNLESGIYFVTLKNGDKILQKEFVLR